MLIPTILTTLNANELKIQEKADCQTQFLDRLTMLSAKETP